jgi:hypothetical protein
LVGEDVEGRAGTEPFADVTGFDGVLIAGVASASPGMNGDRVAEGVGRTDKLGNSAGPGVIPRFVAILARGIPFVFLGDCPKEDT